MVNGIWGGTLVAISRIAKDKTYFSSITPVLSVRAMKVRDYRKKENALREYYEAERRALIALSEATRKSATRSKK